MTDSPDTGLPSGSATTQGRETRLRIFSAALTLVNERGYEGTTIPLVCEKAGVSVGTFYHHFRSKSDILLAYVRDESESLLAYYSSLDDLPRIDALLLCVRRFFGYYSTKGRSFVSSFLSILLSEGVRWFDPRELSLQYIVRDCLERGVATGEFNGGRNADEALALATGLVWDLSCSWCIDGGPAELAELAEERFRRLFDLVQ